MKKINIYFLLVFFSFSLSLKAQWNEINTGIPSPKDICFIDSLIGYITTGSSIYKTTNGGYNWDLLASGVNNAHFIAVYSQDTIVVGKYELKVSYDGGQTWNNILDYAGNIADMAIIGDYIYCMYSSTTSCTWNEQTTSFDVNDLVRSNDFGNTWELVSELVKPPVKLSSISNEVGAAYGGKVWWDGTHCYYSLGTTSLSINGNEYTSGGSIEVEYMAGSVLPNMIKHLIWKPFLGGDLPILSTRGHVGLENEIYLNATDLIFYNYANGYLIKGSDIYRTKDIGDTWTFDINTGSTVIKSLHLENGNILLICTNGSLFIGKYQLNVQEYNLIPNTNILEFPDILVGNTDSKTLNIYNTGSKPITVSTNLNEHFFINPNGTADTLNQLSDVVIGIQESLELNIIFKPEEAIEYNENLKLKINEDPDFECNVSLSGEGTLFNGTFYTDTILCADTIIVNKRWVIPEGVKVEICPGTVVRLEQEPYLPIIRVYGSFIANGENDQKIIFEKGNNKAKVILSNSINDSVQFKNCLFKESVDLEFDGAHNIYIDSCEFDENISLFRSDRIEILNSIFKSSYYIQTYQDLNLTISSSKFFNGKAIQIRDCLFVEIKKNEIFNSTEGALIFSNSSGVIEGNYIYNNANLYDYEGGGLTVKYSNTTISNNFIFNNSSLYEFGGVYIFDYYENNKYPLYQPHLA